MNKTCREFAKLLEKNGFLLVRKKGSHFIYSDQSRTVSINKDLKPIIVKRLIKENALCV